MSYFKELNIISYLYFKDFKQKKKNIEKIMYRSVHKRPSRN